MKILFGSVTLLSLLLASVLVVSAADSPPRIEVEDVKMRMDKGQSIIFVDTRNGSAWARSKEIIPGAIRISSAQEFEAAKKIMHKDNFIVTYCT
jgi:rhodanese-related sulfurtransferase